MFCVTLKCCSGLLCILNSRDAKMTQLVSYGKVRIENQFYSTEHNCAGKLFWPKVTMKWGSPVCPVYLVLWFVVSLSQTDGRHYTSWGIFTLCTRSVQLPCTAVLCRIWMTNTSSFVTLFVKSNCRCGLQTVEGIGTKWSRGPVVAVTAVTPITLPMPLF